MAETPLDVAHATMQADIDDDAARLGFYEKLAGTELFLLLESEPEGDQITPQIFEIEGLFFVLLFDREDRLTQFTGIPAPHASLSGRAVCELLAPQGLGAGLNLDVAPSSILLPPEAIAWLAGLDTTPEQVAARIEEVNVLKGLPENLLSALDARLAAAGGMADHAYLVAVTYEGGGAGHMLGFVNATPAAQPALADTVAQALVFSGLEAGALDVGFFAASDPVAAKLAKCGLRFDLPRIEPTARPAPGSDPEKPPILK